MKKLYGAAKASHAKRMRRGGKAAPKRGKKRKAAGYDVPIAGPGPFSKIGV